MILITTYLNLVRFSSLVVQHFEKKSLSGKLDGESSLLYELGFFLSSCGLSEPLHQVKYFKYLKGSSCTLHIICFFQVYINAKPAPKLTELLFLSVIGHLAKGVYVTEIDDLLARKLQDHVDSHCFLLGIVGLVKQYPDPVIKGLLEYLAQYARSFIAELPRYINAIEKFINFYFRFI